MDGAPRSSLSDTLTGSVGEPFIQCAGEVGGFAEGYDAGDVFGSGSALALVGSAVEEGGELEALADEEDSGALGGVHFVAGEGEKVYVL